MHLIDDLAHDLRHALRDARRRPAFALVVVATIAVCVAASGAVFTVVRSVLWRPLPFPDAQRLVRIFNAYPAAGNPRAGNSGPDLFDRRLLVDALDEVALYTRSSYVLGEGAGSRRVTALHVTPTFFDVLGVGPIAGRAFDPRLEGPDDIDEVVIAHDLWRSTFGGSPTAVGATTTLDGQRVTVAGILPEWFQFSTWDAQVFTPLRFPERQRSDAARHRDWYQMIGRLRPDASAAAAEAEIAALNRVLLAGYPPDRRTEMTSAGYRTVVRPFLDDLTRDVRRPFLLVWAGVALVLAIGAANVVSLYLVRGRARAHELAARLALGASRARIARQLAAESCLLAVAGGALGLLLATSCLQFLRMLEIYAIPRLHDVRLDATVVAAALAAAVAIGIGAGAAPAASVLRERDTGRLLGRRGAVPGSPRFYRGLVSAQIAAAFVLVMASGLLLASLRNLVAIDTGFDPRGVVAASLSLPSAAYPDAAARLAVTRRLLDSIASAPGIGPVAVADQLPLSGATQRQPLVPESGDRATGAGGAPFQTVVSPGYFDALRIALRTGRTFRASDDSLGAPVAIVDETLARAYWPDADALGQRFWRASSADDLDPAKALTVVGVVETIRQNSLTEAEPAGAFYVPLEQSPLGSFRLIARLDGDPEALSMAAALDAAWPGVRERVARVDPTLVLAGATAFDDRVDSTLALQRTPMQLLSAFAVIAVFLGAVGIHGVMAFVVATRRREIGLRKAVGGTTTRIAGMLGREWAVVVGVGLAVGVAGTLAATRGLASLLYETGTMDSRAMAGAVIVIVGACVLAAAAPVRRAIRIDPATILKDD